MRTILSNQVEELLSVLRAYIKGRKVLIVVQDQAMKAFLQMALLPFGVEVLPLQNAVERLLFIGHSEHEFRAHATYLDLFVASCALHPTGSSVLLEEVAKEAYSLGKYGEHRYEKAIPTPARLKMREIRDAVCSHKALRFAAFEEPLKGSSYYDELHLFGISSLCAFHHKFFTHVSELVPVSLYVVSPCMMFWSDICSDKEARKLEKRFCPELLYDRSPLLANCGALGRKLGELLDEVDEAYVVPDSLDACRPDAVIKRVPAKNSSLEALQTHLLLLNSSVVSDETVQLHVARTLLKEVEVLYDSIASLQSADCLIYAPDIELYRPYIDRVFGQRNKLPFQIYSQEPIAQAGVIATFFAMLQLASSRWSADLYLELFECKSVKEKFGLKNDAETLFANCMRHFGFRWGMDEKEAYAGSFEAFKGRFLQSVITASEVSVSDADTIACFLSIIESLYCDLQEGATIALVEKLLENYFAKGDEEYDRLNRALLRLKKSANACNLIACDFSRLAALVQKSLDEERGHDLIPTAPFIFTSFGNFRNYPAKYIALLGMNEGKIQEPYHVIEAIVSCRKMLHISYQHDVNPASCIDDLLKVISTLKATRHRLDSRIEKGEKASDPSPIFINNTQATREHTLSLSSLFQAVDAPLKCYFQKQMALHLFEKKEERLDDDFKEIASYNFNRLKKEAFFLPRAAHPALFKKEFQHLPPALSKACHVLLDEKMDTLLQNGHDRAELFIELNIACKAPKALGKNRWQLPALYIEKSGIHLTGVLSGIIESGIPLFTKKTFETSCRHIPHLALLATLKEKYDLPVALDLLYLEQDAKETITICNPEEKLDDFCTFALHAEEEPCCLYPSWISTLLEEKLAPEGFYEKVMEDHFDPYLQFYLSRIDKEAFFKKWPLWHEMATRLYHSLEGSDEL